jgi:DNA-binding NarL/FixJ family response regulator
VTVTRVLLADDQELVRAGLRLMVDSAPDLTVVGEAATGRQAVRLVRETHADVVLMDIRMPELDGLAATRQITADAQLAGVKVLILTTFEVDEYVFEALRSGASGFLGKGARPDVLIDAIRTVARGDSLLSPAATRGLIARFLSLHDPGAGSSPGLLDVLTEREREIVALVATGMSNAEIADHLTLSPLTVKTHANHAMAKLGARDRAQLVVLAYQAGLASTPSTKLQVLGWRGGGEQAAGQTAGSRGDRAADRAGHRCARHGGDRRHGRPAAVVRADVGREPVLAGLGRPGEHRRVRGLDAASRTQPARGHPGVRHRSPGTGQGGEPAARGGDGAGHHRRGRGPGR